jgi:hypothetical protein
MINKTGINVDTTTHPLNLPGLYHNTDQGSPSLNEPYDNLNLRLKGAQQPMINER